MRPGGISEIRETGAAVKFQSHTLKIAGIFVRKQKDVQDAGEVEWNPESGTSDTSDGAPLADLEETQKNSGLPCGNGGDLTAPDAALPANRSNV